MEAKEIVTKTFEKAKKGGYVVEEVDEYLRDVSVEFKKLQNENAELEKKLEVLANKIREYRNDEDALRDALLIAKKQGILVVNEAKEQAEQINKEAKEQAEKTIADADALAAEKKKTAEKNLEEANNKAKNIVDEANRKADEIHTAMMQQTEREQIVLQRTRKEVAEYTSKILAAYNTHIEFIKSIPSQCENEFVINTAKTVENRKPEESAFAAKPVKAEEEKSQEVKSVEEANTEEPQAEATTAEVETVAEAVVDEATVAEENVESKAEETVSTEETEKAEPFKAHTQVLDEPFAIKKEEKKSSESILFNLGNKKDGERSSLEFRKKD